jgi:peptide deformylase
VAIKNINTVYTANGKKILSTPCTTVLAITQEHNIIIRDLIDTANAHPGCIGLCANQIWENPDVPAPAIFIVPGRGDWAICINPIIDKEWKKQISTKEGCMSIPRFVKIGKRTRHICVSYYDSTNKLQKDVHLFDTPAQIFQHEMDHIRGELLNE